MEKKMRIQAQITVIIASIEYVAVFQNMYYMDKKPVVTYTSELTFFHECVNNALVTRDRSEVGNP